MIAPDFAALRPTNPARMLFALSGVNKSRGKNQLDGLLVRQRGKLLRRKQTPFSGFAPDDSQVDAATVVDRLHDKTISRSRSLKRNRGQFRLPGGARLIQSFDAVIKRMNRWTSALIDFNMPGTDGLELAATIRQMRPDMPMAIVSANIQTEIITGTRRMKANQSRFPGQQEYPVDVGARTARAWALC